MTARYTTALIDALARHGDRTALVAGDRTLTYRELLTETWRMAGALTTLGLDPGDGLVCVAGNSPEVFVLRLSAHVLGLRFTTVHSENVTIDSLEHILIDADPAAVVLAPGSAIPAAGPRPLSLGPTEGAIDLRAVAAGQPADPVAVSARDEQIAKLTYTSGTTGLPKGVPTTFGALASALDMFTATAGEDSTRLRYLTVTPIAHVAGDIAAIMLVLGMTVELHERFDAEAVLATIEHSAPVATFLYPSLLYRLLDHPRTAEVAPGRLVNVTYGSAPMSPARLRQAIAMIGPVFQQGYSQTEAPAITWLSVADHVAGLNERPGLLSSVGRPMPGVEVSVIGADGRPRPAGDVGEVRVRGASTMGGYWRRPELTAEVIRDGWVHTGDLGRFDEDGYLHLVGRVKDMIIVNGHNCYATPIEDVLTGHPGVRHAVVVGAPSDDTGEEIHAFVVGDADETELRETVRRRLGAVDEPAAVHFVSEIPLSGNGKPDKLALAQRHHTSSPGLGVEHSAH